MSIEAFFPHFALIERATETGTDAYNNPIYQWDAVGIDIPCRLVEKRERVERDETAAAMVVTTYKLLLPQVTDINERDRVTVTLEGGTWLGAYICGSVLRRTAMRGRHHLSVDLEAIS